MQNTLEGIKSRLNKAEDQISDLKEKVTENTQSDHQKEKKMRIVLGAFGAT